MIILRLTLSLAKKMNLKLSESQTQSTSKLGDWYASDFRLGPRQFILCTSVKSRFPIVLEAAPYKTFPERLVAELRIALMALGLSQVQVEQELFHFSEIQFAKTKDRSVVGTIVDSIKSLEFMYEAGRINTEDRKWMNGYLARTPHVKLNSDPNEMTLNLFKNDHSI